MSRLGFHISDIDKVINFINNNNFLLVAYILILQQQMRRLDFVFSIRLFKKVISRFQSENIKKNILLFKQRCSFEFYLSMLEVWCSPSKKLNKAINLNQL